MPNGDSQSFVTLKEHLTAYKNLQIASPEDNKEILKFLKNIPMESASVSLRYDRTPDFFSLLKAQGRDAYVIKILNKDKSIGGIGVITLRKAWVNNREGIVAYTSDLRVSSKLSNRSRLDWRNGYTSVIKDFKSITEFKDVDYFHTAILDDNTQALRSLKNPKSKFVYNKVCPYRSISLYGRLPFKKNKHLYKADTSASEEEIEVFLEKHNKQIPAGQFFCKGHAESELKRRQNTQLQYDASNYLVIRNNDNEIISCMIPTSTQEMRKIVIDKMNWRYKLLSYLTPLIKGKRLMAEQGLKILYLSDLTFSKELSDQEKSDIIATYIDYTYEMDLNRKFHLITFLDQYNETLIKTLRKNGHFFETKEGTLFQVSHIDHDDSYLKLSPCRNMSFELALS